ncbi:MAG: LTA synthase family protein [Oscillibacter sp.]|nr:LTA synthase family protein [Oscillibacter sp.]
MQKFWLFQAAPDGLPQKRQAVFWVWNLGVLLAAGLCLGWLSMFFAYGDYPDTIMKTYFQHPLILFLNIAPVVLAVFLMYALTGRGWLAFLLTDLVVWGLSLGNYYKLRFRDDPLMFQDLMNLRDAAAITAMADYDLTPDKRVIFGVLCLIFGTAFLFLLVRGRLPKRPRLALLAACAVLCFPTAKLMENTEIYSSKTQNYDQIERWSSTQVYLSKGFVYPFLHSVTAGAVKPPAGYSEAKTRSLLDSYTPEDIPKEKKVDIIAIQLEAFADFSLFEGVEGVDFERAYGVYHQLEAESVAGNLVTNIFAGGTVDTERAFLTGFADQRNYRANTNSYAWELRGQGYTAEGCHPSYEWFYNRRNVNGYLGVPTYYFIENRFRELYPHGEAPDEVLFPEILRLYEENRDNGGAPYFSFNITYQGHGPYGTEDVWRGNHFTDGRYSTETANIVDNYLGSVMDTAEQLQWLFDQFRGEERPVVLVVFGDHKPWLGYGNSAYQELGVNLDLASEEGFYNYYATRYLLWANDAAKAALGRDFTGEGPDVSSCFLMNLVYDYLGWTGSAWAQATSDIWREIPVLTDVGRYVWNGELTAELDAEGQEVLQRYLSLQYYYSTHFRYQDL